MKRRAERDAAANNELAVRRRQLEEQVHCLLCLDEPVTHLPHPGDCWGASWSSQPCCSAACLFYSLPRWVCAVIFFVIMHDERRLQLLYRSSLMLSRLPLNAPYAWSIQPRQVHTPYVRTYLDHARRHSHCGIIHLHCIHNCYNMQIITYVWI